MATSQRVQILDSKAQELSLLAEYLKNPDLISELSDEIKALNTLSADEEKKADEGRNLIKQRDSILAEIAAKQEALDEAQSEYEDNLTALAQKTQALQDAQKDLDEKTKGYAAADNYLAQSRAQLEMDRKNHENKVAADEQNFVLRLAEIEAMADDNTKEQERLAELDKTLKDKAAKISAVVGE